jgi:hypothetical protein
MPCISGPAVHRVGGPCAGRLGRAVVPSFSVVPGCDAAVDIPDHAAVALLDHAMDHCRGEGEDRPVQFEIGVVRGAVIVLERLRDEGRSLGSVR